MQITTRNQREDKYKSDQRTSNKARTTRKRSYIMHLNAFERRPHARYTRQSRAYSSALAAHCIVKLASRIHTGTGRQVRYWDFNVLSRAGKPSLQSGRLENRRDSLVIGFLVAAFAHAELAAQIELK